MKIVDISAENNGKTGGKKELGAAEKWLFDYTSEPMNISFYIPGVTSLSKKFLTDDR